MLAIYNEPPFYTLTLLEVVRVAADLPGGELGAWPEVSSNLAYLSVQDLVKPLVVGTTPGQLSLDISAQAHILLGLLGACTVSVVKVFKC